MLREPKPFWREVPDDVKEAIEEVLGAPVRRAIRVFGGYGPSATFRLFLGDGRTVFVKGAGIRSTAYHWEVLPLEERAYREIRAIRPWAPRFFGAVRREGWHLLLLEDLRGARFVPPWTEELAAAAVDDIAALHCAGMRDPVDLPPLEGDVFAQNWQAVAPGGPDEDNFLSLCGPRREVARRWVEAALPTLVAHEAQLQREDQPHGIIHCDIRSDNLCLRDGRLVLFDWAALRRGPLAFDIAAFLPSLAAEGGTSAPILAERYAAALAAQGVALPRWPMAAAVCAVAGYFASRAGRAGIAGLPRLRAIQRAQLRVALPWAAALLSLPQPPELCD